jgi:hypothetical protein
MPISLFCPEMREEFLRRQDLDPTLKLKLRGLTIRMVILSTDAPRNQDRQTAINLQGGQFISIMCDILSAPSELRTMPFDQKRFDCRFTAPHSLFVELCSGKTDVITAFPKCKVEGNVSRVMGQIEGIIGLIQYISTLDIVP